MKKGVIALLLVVVLVVLVSPGVVGKLAERSLNENLNWAADESGELTVTTEGFDRRWFSSHGQHRVTLGEGGLRAALSTFSADADDYGTPTLIIDTHIDHGLIPVASMSREHGSLAPGLGSAVSTLTVDFGNGETFDVPGTVYTKVGLGGSLLSNYVLDAGSQTMDDGSVSWEASNLEFGASPNSGSFEFDGNIGSLTFEDSKDTVTIDGLTFKTDQQQTEYGFAVGDVEIRIAEMSMGSAGSMRGLSVVATSSVDGGAVSADTVFELDNQTIPGFGEISAAADMRFVGADAAALGRVSKRLEEMSDASDPGKMMTAAQDELFELFASGLSLDFRQLDVVLPMGAVESVMTFNVAKSDAGSFSWLSLLQNDLVAAIDIKVPQGLIDLAAQMGAPTDMIIGMGYLKKDGDIYLVDADYQKGLLTINGAPVPVPLGAFQ